MTDLLELLKHYGVYLDESVSGFMELIFFFLVLSVFMLLNVVNITIYLVSIYILSNEKILSKIPSKYVYIHKIIKFNKKINIGLIIFEVLILLFCLIVMFSLSFGIVSVYFKLKV